MMTCSVCGTEVDSVESRACGHNNAPVIAHVKAKCTGTGRAAHGGKNWLLRLLALLIAGKSK
jgi:hypothetical protein